jgi:NifU-like protein involved in Fe-S cluster formation
VHAGRLSEAYNAFVVGEAAESETGARIVLSAVVEEDTVCVLRYQVFGCPHLIAAAEAFCEEMEGKPVVALTQLDVTRLMDDLAIPIEKTGKLFILEDAAKALHIMATGA